jgi:hypothetical protein
LTSSWLGFPLGVIKNIMMSELIRLTPISPEKKIKASEYQKNLEILERESKSLAKVYELAIQYDPRLSDVKIVPISKEEFSKTQRPFFARKPWKAESGKGEVHVLFGDGQEIGKMAIKTITENPEFKEQIRQMVYAPKGAKIAPQLVRAFVFLHELGHAVDYYDNVGDPEAYDAKSQMLKNNLPLGNLTGPAIIQKFNSGDIEFQQKVIANFGTLDNAVAKYRHLRHNLSFEKKANKFASEVLRRNVTELVALSNDLFKS